jgi:hypothetical protein
VRDPAITSPVARTEAHAARRLLPGVRTRGRTHDLRAIIAVDATLDSHGLGALRAVRPLHGRPWSTSHRLFP